MKKNSLLVLVFVFMLMPPCIAFAESAAWLKQENPDSLGLYSGASNNCPFEKSKLQTILEGEFLRSRIKPSNSTLLNLTVNVKCLPISNRGGSAMGYAIAYEVRYGTKTANGEYVLYESPDHGSLLVGDKDSSQFILDSIRDSVSESLTEYLKANVE